MYIKQLKDRLMTNGKNIIVRAMNVLIIEPGGAGIQQSQMLRGIKKRAERDYQDLKAQND